MGPIYIMNCEKYAEMASGFYSQYLDVKSIYATIPHNNIDIIEEPFTYVKALEGFNLMETYAIASIVFQALAIEAYINLLGVYILGEEVFYKEYEPPKKPKGFRYLPSIEKLKKICSDNFSQSFPEDTSTHIEELFEKRNRLVHSKPRPYYVKMSNSYNDNPQANHTDIDAFFKEKSFVFDDIDFQMNLYKELKGKICVLRNTETDIVEEIRNTLSGEI